jgi:hypothetical protein
MNAALRNILRQKPYIPIRMNAGLMDFSVTGHDGVKWVFPDGTVSNADRPAVTMATSGVVRLYLRNPSKSGVVVNDINTNANFVGYLKDFNKLTYSLNLANTGVTGKLSDLGGRLTYQLILSNCSSITGSLSDLLGKIETTIDMTGCTLITGSLADLGGRLTYWLNLASCSLITGSLADLQGKITYYLNLNSCSLITGSLSDLGGKLTNNVSLSGCTLITGSLADLQGKITNYLNLTNCNLITGVYTPVGSGTPTTTILTNTGLSTTDMDNTLIAYAAATKNNGSFTATGMTRSAASDAAVATLTAPGRGWSISGITKV